MTKRSDAARLHEAITYAAKIHRGQVRKGTDIDYLSHPMEVLQILTAMAADGNLQIAGVLHDAASDKDTVERCFGDDVLTLVRYYDEDVTLPWKERKTAEVEALQNMDKRQQMLVLADKLSEQRCMISDYLMEGEGLWEKYGMPKEDICWYYSAVQDALKEMQNYEDTGTFYWEMVSTFKDMFVSFFGSQEMDCLYQVADAGCYRLAKSSPEWKEFEEEMPEDVIALTRAQAEHMEAEWIAHYIMRISADDMKNGLYEIYNEGHDDNVRVLNVSVTDKKIQLNVEDSSIYVDDKGYEHPSRFYYALDRKESAIFARLLRTQYGAKGDFATILKDAFGSHDGPIKFKAFCEAFSLGYTYCANRKPKRSAL